MRIIYQFIIIICLMFIGCENNSNPISNKDNVIIYKDVHKNKLEGFDNDGIDSFENMALKGLKVVDLVVSNKMNGVVYEDKWIIPKK